MLHAVTEATASPTANGPAPRLMFAPVSGPRGMGEFARCLAIARAAADRWPAASIRFLLSREAPYAAGLPFPVDPLPASVTLAPTEAGAAIAAFRPQVVVFDNAGRTRLLAAAARVGARIVYVSSRTRQRRRGFRLRWMRRIDEHWIAYPERLVGALGPLERAKLGLFGRPRVRFLDSVLPPADAARAASLLEAAADGRGCAAWPQAVVVPGGGSVHPGAEDLPARFAAAARTLADAGVRTALVAGPAFRAAVEPGAGLAIIRGADVAALRALLERADVVVANGGDTLVQALVLGRACVALPIAADQRERVRRCLSLGIIEAPAADELARTSLALLRSPQRRDALRQPIAALGWRDGMPEALDALERLIGLSPAQRRLPSAALQTVAAGADRERPR